MKTGHRYVLVSPVKDEVRYVERTLRSIANQVVRPQAWVIVDDGSTDGTTEILRQFARAYPWIRLHRLEPGRPRQTGSRVIRNFQAGYDLVAGDDFDFVVKLDCDLELPPNYFEEMLRRFEKNPKLGIASGIYLEERSGQWVPIEMPPYHVAGAMKMLRASCFREINGFVPSPGWDTVDEIKAQVRGWATQHFPDLQVLHLKDEGSGVGFRRMSEMSGEIHYLTGGGAIFFAAKAIHRLLFGQPRIVGSVAMTVGYLRCVIGRRARVVDAREATYYRKMLNRRMVTEIVRLRAPKANQRGARYA